MRNCMFVALFDDGDDENNAEGRGKSNERIDLIAASGFSSSSPPSRFKKLLPRQIRIIQRRHCAVATNSTVGKWSSELMMSLIDVLAKRPQNRLRIEFSSWKVTLLLRPLTVAID